MCSSVKSSSTEVSGWIGKPWGITFSDGSEKTYCVVLYLRWNTDQGIYVRLVESKAKLIPLDHKVGVLQPELEKSKKSRGQSVTGGGSQGTSISQTSSLGGALLKILLKSLNGRRDHDSSDIQWRNGQRNQLPRLLVVPRKKLINFKGRHFQQF